MPDFKPNLFQRTNAKLASTRPLARLFSHTLHHLDKPVVRWSNGRYSAASLLTGVPLVTLTTTGAKSGLPRENPLIGTPDGDKIILIASNWGGKKHPSWYYNLKATPACTLTYDGKTEPYLAREVSGEEKEAVWQKAAAIYPGYEAYKTRTAGREIPVFVLSPDR